jgi:tetratricopeptide (TPR) repeat protein
MTDPHPDLRTLERFLSGELSGEPCRALERHVLTCRICEDRLLAKLPASGAESILSLLQPFEARTPVRQTILTEKPPPLLRRRLDLVVERAGAAALWETLRGVDSASRHRLVLNDGAYRTWGLFELLVDRSRDVLPQQPREAEDLARLALFVAEHLDSGVYGEQVVETAQVKAWTHVANALRVLADFRQAEKAFERAESHLALSWLDPVDEALILELKGAMRRAQGRYGEALELLDDAIALYREVHESHHHGRALMVKGLTLQYQDEPEAAAECFRTSLFLLDGLREPRLLVVSQCNLIGCLHDSGRSAEAAPLVPEAKALIEQVGKRTDLLRLTWMEGKIQVALGQWGAAERAFHWIRESFVEDGLAFDAALVSLDLAGLYIRQRKTAEARLLAEEMLPIFRSHDVHREALGALIVFQRAAEMEQLTLGLIEEVSTFLEQARDNPGLRFRGEAPIS